MDRRFAIGGAAGAAGLLCVLLLVLGIFPGISTADPPEPPTAACGEDQAFYAVYADGNHFGPAVGTTDVDEALAELHTRRCTDPSLTVAHGEYQNRNYSSPEGRARKTRQLLNSSPGRRTQAVQVLEDREATAVTVEVTTMTEQYQTMYMVTAGHDVPYVYATTVDRPSYRVLKFTYADGSWDAYKLDCGFQPVDVSFPGLPSNPPPGSPPPDNPPPGNTPECPPDMPYGHWPVCKDSPSNDPANQGNVPPQVQGPAPPVVGGPTPPAAGNPPPVYEPPPRPQPPTVPRPEPPPPNQGQDPDAPVPGDDPGGPDCNPAVCTV